MASGAESVVAGRSDRSMTVKLQVRIQVGVTTEAYWRMRGPICLQQPLLPPSLLPARPLERRPRVHKRNVRLLALEQLGEGDDLEAGVGAAPGVFEAADGGGFAPITVVGLAAVMKTPIGAFSRSIAEWRSRIIWTPTLPPPLTETIAFSVRLPSGLK